MTIKTSEITVGLLKEECGHRAFERGSNYFRQGRVLQFLVQNASDDHLLFTATNRGSGGRLYEQEIDLYRVEHDLYLEGVCTCPVGYNCKHVVAACLAARQAGAGSREVTGGDDFAQWLARLAPAKEGEASAEPDPSPDHLLYSLKPEAHGDSLEVGFSVARRKRDGRFGKGRRTNLPSFSNYYGPPAYLRQEDEEIAALLRASGMNVRGAVTLKGKAGGLALKLMLDSGRLFWGDQRDSPLHEAPPRQIGLVWKEENRRFRLRLDVPEGLCQVPVEPPLFIDAQRQEVGELILPAGIDSAWLRQLDSAPPIPRKEAKRIGRWLALNHPQLPTPLPIAIDDIGQPTPTPRLTLGQAEASPLETPLTLDFL